MSLLTLSGCQRRILTGGFFRRSQCSALTPAKMAEVIADARARQDSVGGIVECGVTGLPAGIGDPMFGGLENRIASLVFGIPAVKGIEFGSGFAAAAMHGSEHNDRFINCDGTVKTATNNHGGILGGISGIIITSHLNSAKSSNGSTYTLLSLLIVVLGGINPDGGGGTVAGVTFSIVLLQLIANAFTIMHAPDTLKTLVNGCLLVAALILDKVMQKREMQKSS